MGILESLTGSSNRQPSGPLFSNGGRGNAAQASDRPKAKVWLNIGYQRGDKFINLPIGLPVDTMDKVDVRGQNEDWIKFQTARNAFLDDLQKYGAQLEAGQEVILNPDSMIQIRLRRVSETVEVKAEDNEYAVDLGTLLAGPSANQMAAE